MMPDKHRKNEFCPLCKSFELEGDSFDVVVDEVVQPMRCLRCHTTWDDVYSFNRRDRIKEATE
jgi:hypothetical protein